MGPAQGDETREMPRGVPPVYAKYALLLPLILANLVVFGFEDHHPAVKSISHWFAAGTLVLALYASRVGRGYFIAMASLALIATAAWSPAQAYHRLPGILVVSIATLIALAPIAIFRRVWSEFVKGGVDTEVVLGVLCAYLYIGSWYAFLYRAAAFLSNRPFFAQPGTDDGMNYVYFSFITLATVGYGDLSPAYGPGRMLAATEGIIGQLYLVSVVALVVSAFGKGKAPPS